MRRIPLSRRSHIIGFQPLPTGTAEHESALERDFVTLTSFLDPHAVITAQPITITFQIDGAAWRYTPDYSVAWSDGRREIVETARKIASDVAAGKLSADDIDESLFSRYLSTGSMPDPDLLIRTSGELRISNFLLYQSAYTEIYFSRVFWPDFRRRQLYEAISDFQKRERRFGLVSEQVKRFQTI